MSRKPAAFSLVELIVVIGIIALLISLLLPTTALIREKANQTKCMATLHNIGLAAQLHLNDHAGFYPCAGWEWNPIGGVVNPKGMGDEHAVRYDYYVDADEHRPMPVTAALAIEMGAVIHSDSRDALEADLQGEGIRKYFHCPSDQQNLSGWTQRDSGGWESPDEFSSYAFNEGLMGRRDRDPATSPFPLGHATQVHQPSQVFFALDGRTRDTQDDRCFLVFDFGPDDSLEDFNTKIQTTTLGKELIDFWRHRRRMNVLFVDGHVDTYSTDSGDLSQIGVSKGIN
jgi:prepilin-type processing-associated H-X9-DG protein